MTLTRCPSCHEDIREKPQVVEVPSFCAHCGEAFPWAEQRCAQERRAPDPAERLVAVLSRFDRVAIQLRKRDRKEPLLIADEYDVQYVLRALLSVDFDDIRSEEATPSFVVGSARADFLLKNEQIIIEVKKTRDDLGPKELKKQLLEDIPQYRQHPDCRTLVCFIYDPAGRIDNQAAMKRDLEAERRDTMRVIVVIAPAR